MAIYQGNLSWESRFYNTWPNFNDFHFYIDKIKYIAITIPDPTANNTG